MFHVLLIFCSAVKVCYIIPISYLLKNMTEENIGLEIRFKRIDEIRNYF